MKRRGSGVAGGGLAARIAAFYEIKNNKTKFHKPGSQNPAKGFKRKVDKPTR